MDFSNKSVFRIAKPDGSRRRLLSISVSNRFGRSGADVPAIESEGMYIVGGIGCVIDRGSEFKNREEFRMVIPFQLEELNSALDDWTLGTPQVPVAVAAHLIPART